MRFGANYIPSKNWLYSWLDFDEESIKKDLQTLKNLGFDHIRAHLLWSYFQTNETAMSEHCLINLEKFAKICDEVQIDFFLTLFTGWMSGFVFLPSWLNVGGFDIWRLGMFTDERAIEAEKLYIREIGKVVSKSKTFIGFDLGNELNCLTRPEIDPQISEDAADKWSHIMFEECEKAAPGKMHSNGMAHAPWFGKTYFSREVLSTDGVITPLHAWVPFTGTNSRYGWNSIETYSLPNYMSEMAIAYAKDPNRQCWVQEFGMADQWFKTEDELKDFIFGTLKQCAAQKNMWGITWWCSHDISDKYTGFVDFEHNLGLIDVNNNPKPAGLFIKEFIDEYKKNGTTDHIKPTNALIIKEGTGEESDYTNAEVYMKYVKKGIYPAFVTPENAQNQEYLKLRGITEIIQ